MRKTSARWTLSLVATLVVVIVSSSALQMASPQPPSIGPRLTVDSGGPLQVSLTAVPAVTQIGTPSDLQLSVQGGVAPVGWTLLENGSSTNLTGVALSATGGNYTFSPRIASVYTFYLSATDALGSAHAQAAVTVDPALQASLNAAPATTDLGRFSNLSLGFTGGVHPITWTLARNGTGNANITGVLGSQYTFVPAATGVYTFYLNATDAVGSTSDVLVVVTVGPALSPVLTRGCTNPVWLGSACPLFISVSGGVPPVNWTLEVSGSSANLTALWVVIPPSPLPGWAYVFSPTTPGTYTFYLNSTDALGSRAESITEVIVASPLSTGLINGCSSPKVGTACEFLAAIVGGLPPVTWTVTVNGSSANLTGGTYTSFPVSGWLYSFTPKGPGTYTFYLNASDTIGNTSSSTTTVNLPPYPVEFTENGLSSSLLAKDGWSVAIGPAVVHSFTASISFSLANGSYPVLVTGPAGFVPNVKGTTTVSGITTVSVTFSKGKTVVITFAEKGLVKGTNWCVAVEMESQCSVKASQKSANLAAGVSYDYSVISPVAGQNITQRIGKAVSYGSSGDITPTANVKVGLTFAYFYTVTFTETGLSSGAWAVTIGGQVEITPVGQSLEFNLTNGTYGYKVGTISGYTSSGSPKKVTVPTVSSVIVTFTSGTGKSGKPGFVFEWPMALAALPLGLRGKKSPR